MVGTSAGALARSRSMMFLPARPGTAERGRAEVGSAHQPGRLGLVERHDILLDSRFLIGSRQTTAAVKKLRSVASTRRDHGATRP
jgi:hypothetical protein